MPYQPHSADRPFLQRLVGGLRFGIDKGMLVDADLASTLAAAKAAVNVDNGRLHVAHRQFANRINASLDRIGDFDATYIGGSDADKATMVALAPTAQGNSYLYL